MENGDTCWFDWGKMMNFIGKHDGLMRSIPNFRIIGAGTALCDGRSWLMI